MKCGRDSEKSSELSRMSSDLTKVVLTFVFKLWSQFLGEE